MHMNHHNEQRFPRVLRKLNNLVDQPHDNSNQPRLFAAKPHHNILLARYSQQSSKENFIARENAIMPIQISHEETISILVQPYQVIFNKVSANIHCQFVPTSTGVKYILLCDHQQDYINLSWLHSVQSLENTKILLLYYQISKILDSSQSKKANITSKVIEFWREQEARDFLNAVNYVHTYYHDKDAQRIYHHLTSE